MISEPELVDGGGFPDPVAPLSPPPPVPGPAPRTPRRRGPWVWALGGAVLASAVWAGGLYAYHRQDRPTGPDLRGYRAVDPCRAATFEGLSAALGRREEATNPLGLDEPGLYRVNCLVTLDAKPVPYDIEVTYALHRVTDPRPEFEALMHDPLVGGGDRIDGLGDTAYLNDSDDAMVLDVLDGQAEIRLRLSAAVEYDENGNPKGVPRRLDPAALRTYLVEDMRQLMTALRTK
ncbi:hypothetical protein [Streptomyces sp. NPDC053431]|uniref:hypothetical protein n=1 Tax=Streptomyces sp. NPDC053431 TaxID=3365703 RepID=UPI0037D76702